MFIGFGKRGREVEREGEKHQFKRETSIGIFHMHPTWEQTHNSGICLDQELNW